MGFDRKQFRRLAALDLLDESWRRPAALNINEAQVDKNIEVARKLHSIFEATEAALARDGYLPTFGWSVAKKFFERALIESDEDSMPHDKEAHSAHWAARNATHAAHELHQRVDPHAAHQMHAAASAAHHKAAQHFYAKGDVDTANKHSAWQQHHDQWAAHHAYKAAGLPTNHAGKQEPVGAPNPHKRKKGKAKKLPGYEDVDDATHKQVKGAMQSTRVAHSMRGDHEASPEEVAAAHHDAGHEHLQAALHLFHGGHHEKALTHFQAAMDNMQKHKEALHTAKAQKHQKARHAAGGGPRAARGYAHV